MPSTSGYTETSALDMDQITRDNESTELTSVVIGTDCIGSCKSNYHTITSTTAPRNMRNVNNIP
jgi:hypothetical protein